MTETVGRVAVMLGLETVVRIYGVSAFDWLLTLLGSPLSLG